MSDQIYLMLGKVIATLEAVQSDVSEIKADIKENINPVLSDYQSTKNKIIGGCMAVSAVSGALMSILLEIFKK